MDFKIAFLLCSVFKLKAAILGGSLAVPLTSGKLRDYWIITNERIPAWYVLLPRSLNLTGTLFDPQKSLLSR